MCTNRHSARLGAVLRRFRQVETILTVETSIALQSEQPLIVYLDIKSPYAFIAKDPTYALADELGIEVDWRPLTLDIPSYLGSAKTDGKGKVLEQNRSPAQWQAVKYAYADAKRSARARDLVLKGTTKIWDSSLAGMGILWAKQQSQQIVRAYLDITYPRFWRRELDIEDPEVIVDLLTEAGAEVDGFLDYIEGPGRVAHDELQDALHPAGIFGVPTYVVKQELFFGREHLPLIKKLLSAPDGGAPDVSNDIAYESICADQPLAGRG